MRQEANASCRFKLKIMKSKLIILVLAFVLGCNSFTGKQSYMKDFEQFILVIKNRPSITDEEWQQFDRQFADLSEVRYKKYEQELTTEEFRKIDGWRSDYHFIRFGAQVKGGIKDGVNRLQQLYNGFSK